MNITKKLIFIALFILLILSILFYWFSRQPISPSKITNTPFPTVSIYSKSSPLLEGNQRGVSSSVSTKIDKPIIFQDLQIQQLNNLKKQLPIITSKYNISYSPLLDHFFIQKTSTDSTVAVNEWISQNNFTELVKNQSLFSIYDSNEPIQTIIAKQENIFKNNHELLLINAPTIKPTSSTNSTNSTNSTDLTDLTDSTGLTDSYQGNETAQTLRLISELLGQFDLNMPIGGAINSNPNQSPSISQITPTPFTPLISPNKLTGPISTPVSLQSLITEASQKVGVPYKILEGIMTMENPAVFNLSDAEVGQKSTPGSGITCPIANCSEQGPMQMTTGRDADGRTDCPKCCWNGNECSSYCPNAWGQYGGSINKYGGYTHIPNPCDLRDNIFAAALKLKTDSGASSPTDWTYAEVHDAGYHYHGNCSYPYPRFNNQTYCDYLWNYYKQ